MPHPLFLVVSVLHLFSTVRVVGGFFFYISLRGERDCSAERRGLLWQGAPASRARVEIDCAERPAGLFSCVFVPVRSGGMARGLRDSAGLALAVSVKQRRQGGGLGIIASHRISSATRWEAEAAKCRHGGPFVRAGRDPQSKNDHLGICL